MDGSGGSGGRTGVVGRLTRPLRRPAVAVLLLAPFLGEVLSTATPPVVLLVPWSLALLVALYGGGALLVREATRRLGLGLLGLLLLAAAYAVWEEALVDRFWFSPSFWADAGVGDYGVLGPVNVLLAVHLTAFHVAVSMVSSIVVVERLLPAYRTLAWAGPGGLVLAGLGLLVLVPFLYGEVPGVPVADLVGAGVLLLVLVAAALVAPRRPAWSPGPAPGRRPRAVATVAFLAAGTHFVLVYVVPSTGLPWPAGLLLTLLPILAGALLVPRLAGPRVDPLPVVTGVLAFFCLLTVLVGLLGQYDLAVAGLAAAYALWWLGRRTS